MEAIRHGAPICLACCLVRSIQFWLFMVRYIKMPSLIALAALDAIQDRLDLPDIMLYFFYCIDISFSRLASRLHSFLQFLLKIGDPIEAAEGGQAMTLYMEEKLPALCLWICALVFILGALVYFHNVHITETKVVPTLLIEPADG